MGNKFTSIADVLCCPNDGASLQLEPTAFRCTQCHSHFPIHEGNFTEILPTKPSTLLSSISDTYREAYYLAFNEAYCKKETSRAWGAEEAATSSWVRKRYRQVAMIKPLVTEGTKSGEAILCDVSAGAGYYTFEYSRLFRFVIHCDLSVDNLNYAWRKAQRLGIHNIFFIRADYFALPFRQSLDAIICFDTAIRGETHDSLLLTSIVRSLKPGGRAVVDFHNWWHNPIRRLGLLPNNFRANRSYVRAEVESLLRKSGIIDFSYWPFYQEIENHEAKTALTSVLPPTRLVYRVINSELQSKQWLGSGDHRLQSNAHVA